jgi:hypothetical protein
LPNPKAFRRAARPGEGLRDCRGLRDSGESEERKLFGERSRALLELEVESERSRGFSRELVERERERRGTSRSAVIGVVESMG